MNRLYVYIYIPPGFLPIKVSTEHGVEFPVLCSTFSLVICFKHSIHSVCMSIPTSRFIPPSWYPCVCSLHLCVSFCFASKGHLYHFSRFHVYVLIYNVCFSLSDLLPSVWQSLGPSMSLQTAQFHSFLQLNNIPLDICTTSSLSIPLSLNI